MIKPFFSPPWNAQFAVAVSGGVDSMAVLDFIVRGKRNPFIAFFDHGTKTSNDAKEFIFKKIVPKYNLDICVGTVTREKYNKESPEEYWRNERYKFLNSFNCPIITAHHLDDAVETWVFGAINGQPKLIPSVCKNVYRPFLAIPKQDLIEYAVKHDLEWIEDNSNLDLKYSRNRIRHNIIPEILKVNPGIRKVIAKKYKNDKSI